MRDVPDTSACRGTPFHGHLTAGDIHLQHGQQVGRRHLRTLVPGILRKAYGKRIHAAVLPYVNSVELIWTGIFVLSLSSTSSVDADMARHCTNADMSARKCAWAPETVRCSALARGRHAERAVFRATWPALGRHRHRRPGVFRHGWEGHRTHRSPASQTDQPDGRMISLKARSVSEQRAVPAGGKRLTPAAAV